MADNNKAYNFSVRDDTTFRVEGGETVENNTIIVTMTHGDFDDEFNAETYIPSISMAQIKDHILAGKTVVLRSSDYPIREWRLSVLRTNGNDGYSALRFINIDFEQTTTMIAQFRFLESWDVSDEYFREMYYTAELTPDE